MDTYVADIIGNMLVNIVSFMMNLSGGYILMMISILIGSIVLVYMKFFTDLLDKPQW